MQKNIYFNVQPGQDQEQRDQDTHGPGHVTEEAGHGHALFFGDGTHHEVGGVADVAVGAHEHGTGGDGGQGGRHVGHQVHGVAAGGVEEHQVGGRVVQEAGQGAGQPEEHVVHGLAVMEDHVDDTGQGAVGTGTQDGQGGDHAQEDAQEELGHFFDGGPGEAVEFTALAGGELPGQAGQAEQQDVAQQVLAIDAHAVDVDGFAEVDHAGDQHTEHDAQQEEQVDGAVEAQLFFHLVGIMRGLGTTFTAVQDGIEHEVDAQQGQGYFPFRKRR